MKRKLFLSLLAICASAVLVLAQPRNGRQGGMREGGKANVEKLKKDLNLTDDQVTKITAIYQEFGGKMKENRDIKNEGRDEMKEAQEKMNAQLKKVLTKEQYEKMVKMREERREKRK